MVFEEVVGGRLEGGDFSTNIYHTTFHVPLWLSFMLYTMRLDGLVNFFLFWEKSVSEQFFEGIFDWHIHTVVFLSDYNNSSYLFVYKIEFLSSVTKISNYKFFFEFWSIRESLRYVETQLSTYSKLTFICVSIFLIGKLVGNCKYLLTYQLHTLEIFVLTFSMIFFYAARYVMQN